MKRCAIYTRKSTEEGLDQAFNSLDAQREACEAYIASQRHEGWKLVKTRFDDGGLSGGNMDRPALKALLAEIDAGRIDLIVVYKVDRLTRSLADFAKLVERFDAQEVSFVSVTQQFNTSSSMGRLTLNVLLSFAQFEREVTAERIKDKIAASRRKGMWTGGNPPLGYDNIDKKLVVNEVEAVIVRSIFDLYLKTGHVRAIINIGMDQGWVTKRRANGKGGKPLSRGPLYHILANPIYAGLMRQGKDLHPGEHDAIIARDLWEKVQEKRKASTRWTGPKGMFRSSLTGKLYANDRRLTPSHAKKGRRRYRYYISHANASPTDSARITLRADDVEQSVATALDRWIVNPKSATLDLVKAGTSLAVIERVRHALEQHVTGPSNLPASDLARWAPIIERIDITDNAVSISLDVARLLQTSDLQIHLCSKCTITAPAAIRHCGQERRFLLGDVDHQRGPDPAISGLLSRAHHWKKTWFENPERELATIAEATGADQSTVSKTIRLAFLAPDIIEAFLSGSAPIEINAETLKRLPRIPASWAEQRKLLGFDERR
ncbi:recombinase family protein [Hyphococcus lacteus]|uniref:Recombinase family protein n=1 Tax=Hyphococcus lacteus TaxID=3143536 RepID=A0ABV3YZJ6_9PROT